MSVFGLGDLAFMGAVGAPVGPADPFFANVSLLLHGDGPDGSTTIIDSSPSPKTVTVIGDAQISTAQSVFGGASLKFDGTGDRLVLPTPMPNDSRLGDVDFTIEFWAYTLGTGKYCVVGNLNDSNGAGHYWVILNETVGGACSFAFGGGSNTGSFQGNQNIRFGTAVLSVNTWHYIAISRSGTSIRGFLNGTQLGSTQTINNFSGFGNTGSTAYDIPYYIGASHRSSASLSTESPVIYELNGYIDELRITKGVARYTANFTPPTAPFPDA